MKANIGEVIVRPLGGKMVLPIATGSERVEKIVNRDHACLLQWFDVVRPWSTHDVGCGRVTWVRCYGVPLYEWSTLRVKVDDDLFLTQAVEEAPSLEGDLAIRRTHKVKVLVDPSLHSSFESHVDESTPVEMQGHREVSALAVLKTEDEQMLSMRRTGV
ncbi:hypothetical protein Ancab_011371 [Ancistrocladus abbreviatus]